MERETIEIETPIGKHKIVLKTYLTGREQRAIEAVFLGSVDWDVQTQTVKSKFTVQTAQLAENETIKQQVVSIDGKTENVLDLILDMRSEDFAFVKDQLQKLSLGPTSKKKQA